MYTPTEATMTHESLENLGILLMLVGAFGAMILVTPLALLGAPIGLTLTVGLVCLGIILFGRVLWDLSLG